MPQRGYRIFSWVEDEGRFRSIDRVKTGIAHGHKPMKSLLNSYSGNDGRTWTNESTVCLNDGSTWTNLEAVCTGDGQTWKVIA